MMMGELFASDVKGVASAIAVMFNWTLVFIITKTFGIMQESWGSGLLIEFLSKIFTTKLFTRINKLRFSFFSLTFRSNFLFLRGLHGGWNNFRLHQSP